jgi:hypothetical protein
MQQPQSYRPEEIQEIIKLAVTREAYDGELSRQHLVEIAQELGISEHSLQLAERDWLNDRIVLEKKQAFNLYRKRIFKQKAIKYLLINAFFVLINLISAGTLSWSIYILAFFGLKLSLDIWQVSQTEGDDYEKAFQNWERKRQIKQTLETLWDKLQKAWQA